MKTTTEIYNAMKNMIGNIITREFDNGNTKTMYFNSNNAFDVDIFIHYRTNVLNIEVIERKGYTRVLEYKKTINNAQDLIAFKSHVDCY